MADDKDTTGTDAAVSAGGSYEVLTRRLQGFGTALGDAARALNTSREQVFGGVSMEILGNERIRTENNCRPVDIVNVQGALLFGYDVFLGLKQGTAVHDVLSLHRFKTTETGFEVEAAPEAAKQLLGDATFVREFGELFQYYKDARLVQLRVDATRLLAVLQTGATLADVKVFRWALATDGSVSYLDNRGERDHVFPPTHDFEWTPTTRDDHVRGRHPHVNVLDTVFVETVGGDLTIKIEDNTEDGQGIYAEPVVDANQSLDDAEISYARLGSLILLSVKPYREDTTRYLVYNTTTQHVLRIDAIGQSCVSLPEDHGILFPGGYYLADGDHKVFDAETEGLELERQVAAPNGEDVLFVFHRRSDGLYALYPYNMIRKEVSTPLHANGYSLFEDGTMLVMRATDEPTRVHPMAVWRTPFVSAEHADQAPKGDGPLDRIGNKDLVRGISDALTIERLVRNPRPNRAGFEEVVRACSRFVDAYFWASDAAVGNLRETVVSVRQTAERVIDEFEKVVVLQRKAAATLTQAVATHDALLTDLRPETLASVESYLDAMTRLRLHRGHMITLEDTRYIDTERLQALAKATADRFDAVSQAAVDFLEGPEAFSTLAESLDGLLASVEPVTRAVDLVPLRERLDGVSEGVDLLAEVVAGLEVDDPTRKTQILDAIGEVFSHTNRVRAVLDARDRSLRGAEAKASFGAQIKLFGQAVQSALGRCDTPEACDDQLSRLLLQLEELEAQFGEFDDFLPVLSEQREAVYEAISGRRQTLVDERNRRIASLMGAAERILQGVERRAKSFKGEDELNTFFASDPMIDKVRKLAGQLATLGDGVKSEELQSRIKRARQDALRTLRDALELFVDGEDLVRFGQHAFRLNRQPIELTLVPSTHEGEPAVALHLTGTDFHQRVDDAGFAATRPYWNQTVASETEEVYRAETLAYLTLQAAERGELGLSLPALEEAVLVEDGLLAAVRKVSATRLDEGYDRGLHDVDAAKLLAAVWTLRSTAGLLRYGGTARSLAALWWSLTATDAAAAARDAWSARAKALVRLRDLVGPSEALSALAHELGQQMVAWCTQTRVVWPDGGEADAVAAEAGRYLCDVLGRDTVRFVFSGEAGRLREGLTRWLEAHGGVMAFEDALRPLAGDVAGRLAVWQAWLGTLAERVPAAKLGTLAHAAWEAAVLGVVEHEVAVDVSAAAGTAQVTGLLGRHPRLQDGALTVRLDGFLQRLQGFVSQRMPGFTAYRADRSALLDQWRRRLRLDELEPKVMSAFVRNKLINEVYLPMVGDNLAKQIGAAGDSKRTDQMGLLLLVSPPGYGKTTLMEYVASRLGLVFVKVNGPALGHSVTSLDPAEAPNATARQEVEKINLAFELGNNVMLYLDDIQHTHPELLQKFISLCDGSRRIEGVWNGRTRTYDLRGKTFAVVMAGNPYTETGESFQIPDMLANRADTYNLGEVLGGREEAFALSFVENALTANPTLAPLAARAQGDVYTLVRMASGEDVPASELQHDYASVELDEIKAVLKHLLRCRDTLLLVNAEYVRSAAMEDAFRTEPRFQLQGSYRNMAKLAEKVAAAMTVPEVDQVIADHYRSEAQTLTTGAEFNLLRLAELRGTLTPTQSERLGVMREEYRRLQLVGGGDDDPVTRVSGAISGLSQQLGQIGQQLAEPAVVDQLEAVGGQLGGIAAALQSQPAPVMDGIEHALGKLRGAVATAGMSAEALMDVAAPLNGILQALREGSGGGQDLAPLLAELQGLRTAVTTRGELAAKQAGPGAPVQAAQRTVVSRAALMEQARRALDGDLRAVDASDDPTLAAALSVIEMVTVHMAAAARSRLPPDQHDGFLEELRRMVARAVGRLAG